ncbi:unnamed protein product [Dracunculus medinensis]|uniref:Uncharacterized protein n=1 Tax=Dracunculus medinensis TaxID=318479 RepID=A0A0N4UNB7_DRAME|nr:unnamed protein product [Dracunculus medinensis]
MIIIDICLFFIVIDLMPKKFHVLFKYHNYSAEKIKYGDRLTDKLNSASVYTSYTTYFCEIFKGLFNSYRLLDRKFFFQILYDQLREHYILVEKAPSKIALSTSETAKEAAVIFKKTTLTEIKLKLITINGQEEEWSCGHHPRW